VDSTQTEITAMVGELHGYSSTRNCESEMICRASTDAGTGKWSNLHHDPLTVPEAVANAMWNYKFVVYDNSKGVHNWLTTQVAARRWLWQP
jgi:hypothetical protein